VLHQACRELSRWQAAGRRDLALSVNVSPIQFRRGDVEDTLRRALAATGADPGGLELEFGEAILAEGSESVRSCLGRLKALGVRLVIDDYGSGSSSLSALKRFGIDALKIDRAFVGGLLTTTRRTRSPANCGLWVACWRKVMVWAGHCRRTNSANCSESPDGSVPMAPARRP
jgi:EAL domain-containing protein (putative c-di-GMP-specific phosphodiesterase class I)